MDEPSAPRTRIRDSRLCLLATAAVARRPLLDAVDEALRGGVDMVQLREKTARDAEVLATAKLLRSLCDRYGVPLIVNDRIEVARDAGADGVHLGQEDRPVAEARRMLPRGALIGVSTHDADELTRALRDGADYVGVGSVFPTSTKGRDVPVSGATALAPLGARAESAGVPAFAIGGITTANVPDVARAGFRRVAVTAGILAADDPRAAAAAFQAALDAAAGPE